MRLSVVGAGANARVGPRKVQFAPTAARVAAVRVRSCEAFSRVGIARVARVAFWTAAAGMYLRG